MPGPSRPRSGSVPVVASNACCAGAAERPQTQYSHELVDPLNSTYAPWHDDHEFREVYDAVEGSTLVDQYKCYELWEQLGQLTHVEGDILEVGVWRGGTGVLMARRSSSSARRHGCCSATRSRAWPRPVSNDPWYKGGEHSDTSPEHVRGLARSLGVDVELLVGMFPDETGDQIEDVSSGWSTSTSTSTTRPGTRSSGPGRA